MDAPAISVVVPVRDRRAQMLRCLDALLEQDHGSYEVIVADNGSTDGTPEACRERARGAAVPVRVVTVHGSLGRVRNQGAALARGEVVAFTDSDCLPAPGWLAAGARALATDPALGVVCGRTEPEHPITRPWPKTMVVPELTGRFESCNAFYRAAALRAGPGFHEDVGDGWEDTAAGYAVLAAGWGAGFAPDAVVRHDVTYPGFVWHLRREQRQRNLAHVLGRHPEIRRELLFARLFLSRRSACMWLAAIGLALRPAARAAPLLAVPYAVELGRSVRPWRVPQAVAIDVALSVGVVRGALRHRRLVL